jgi:FlgD Ig-like domain
MEDIMVRWTQPALCSWASLLVALAATCPGAALAQGYAIKWNSLDGGGAMRSTGGAYSVGGTIGQTDTGRLTAAGYTLTGGFWAIPAQGLVDTPRPEIEMAPGRLSAARPNPFGASTEVAFALSHEGPVHLDVFDLGGRLVRTLVGGPQPAGTFHVHWDGANDGGRRLPAGIYFFRLETDSGRTTQRVVMLH